jgi:chaperonin GroEL
MQEARKDEAIRLSRTLQMAARRGVIAGGGAALLKASLSLCGGSGAGDVAWGRRCLARALEAPLVTIAANAGFDPSATVGLVKAALHEDAKGDYGFNVRDGCVVDMLHTGIVDSAEVVERALHTATSMAAMAITTDAIVHHRKPAFSTNP